MDEPTVKAPLTLFDAHLRELAKRGLTLEALHHHLRNSIGIVRANCPPFDLRTCYPDVGYDARDLEILSDQSGSINNYQRLSTALIGVTLKRKGATYLVRACRGRVKGEKLEVGDHVVLEDISTSRPQPRDLDLPCVSQMGGLELVKLDKLAGQYLLNLGELPARVAKRHHRAKDKAYRAEDSSGEASEAEEAPRGRGGVHEIFESFSPEYVLQLFQMQFGDEGLKELERLCQERRREKLVDDPPQLKRSLRLQELALVVPEDSIIPDVGVWLGRYVHGQIEAMSLKLKELEVRETSLTKQTKAPPEGGLAHTPKRSQNLRSQAFASARLRVRIERPQEGEKYFLLYPARVSDEFMLFFASTGSLALPQMNEAFVEYPCKDACLLGFEPPEHFVCLLVSRDFGKNMTKSDLRNVGMLYRDPDTKKGETAPVLVSCVRDVDYVLVRLAETPVPIERIDEIYTRPYEEAIKEYSRLALANLHVDGMPLDEFLRAFQRKKHAEAAELRLRTEFFSSTLTANEQAPFTKDERATKAMARRCCEGDLKTRSGRVVKNRLEEGFLRNDGAKFAGQSVREASLEDFAPLPNAVIPRPFIPLCNASLRSERWAHAPDCPAVDDRVISLVSPLVLAAMQGGKTMKGILPMTLMRIAAMTPPCQMVRL